MILTEKFAKKYFGTQDPMGKQMIIEQTVFYIQ